MVKSYLCCSDSGCCFKPMELQEGCSPAQAVKNLFAFHQKLQADQRRLSPGQRVPSGRKLAGTIRQQEEAGRVLVWLHKREEETQKKRVATALWQEKEIEKTLAWLREEDLFRGCHHL